MLTSSITLILPLADAQKNRRTGEKATNLSRLVAARFAVPKGFVLSADAYRSHLWASGAREIASAEADAQERESIREAILSHPIPEDVRQSVAEAYKRLSWQTGLEEPKVAVRPSALDGGPDGAGFPGAYESYLNVSGLEALDVAIKRVWASLWSGKAAAFRMRSESVTEPAMAVVVQQMVEAEVSGTASTADPVTGDPHGVAVTMRPGEADSTRHRVNLRDLSVEGPESIDEGLVKLVAEQAILIEDAIGGKVEVEWAADRYGIWILQAGPIEDLPPYFPVDWANEAEGRALWIRQDARPLSHLARSMIIGNPRLRALNGFLYARREVAAEVINARDRKREIDEAEALLREWEKRTRGLSAGPAEAARVSLDWMQRADEMTCRFADLLCEAVEDRALAWRLLGGVDDAAFERDALLQELSDRFAIAEQSGKLDDEVWWRGYKGDVESFARDYGYAFRDMGEAADPARWRSWISDTDPVFRMIGAISRRGASPSLVTLHCAAAEEAVASEADVLARIPSGKQANVKRLLELARGWVRTRSEAEVECARAGAALRAAVMEMAGRLEQAGVLASREDAFCLDLEELAALPSEPSSACRDQLATKIAGRKHDQWLERRLTPPEMLPINDVPPCYPSIPASPGQASGHARVVNSIEDASEIERGDILVIGSPNLAWTPFLALAGGLICRTGHDMSPLAISARVYGIPAVMSCAVSGIRDGQKVSVDGTRGAVTL